MQKEDVLLFLREHKEEMRQRFGLVKIGLFGSFVRDEQKNSSDIDLAVEIKSPNRFRSFFGLKAYLEEHLHRHVDLGIESSIKPTVYRRIRDEIEYV